jgi:capsular polysaccharide transport system permease protein
MIHLRTILINILLQIRIVLALQDRDLLEKSGKGVMGAFGVMLEPLILIATLLFFRLALRLKGIDLVNPVIWMSIGVCLFKLFLDVGLKSLSGVKKSQDVFFYRRIRPLDTILASAMVATRIYGTVLTLIILLVWAFTWQVKFDNPGEAVLVVLFTVLLALGVGVSALVIGHRLPWFKLAVRFGLKRLLLWTSGVFYAVYLLPGPARPFVTWNPLLHSVELFRHSINIAYPVPGISLSYLSACALLTCGFSLLFYSLNEDLLISDD